MRKYLGRVEAEAIARSNQTLGYIHIDRNLQDFPPVQGNIATPNSLLLESMHLWGKNGPKLILELGAAAGVDGIYLAAQGHQVVAVDSNPAILEWAREKARELGVSPANFIPRVQDVRDISSSERYDVVHANMLLHYLDEEDARRTVRRIQDVTSIGGFNILSVYTEDNPDEEVAVRGMKYLFKLRELSRSYSNGKWIHHRDQEGLSPFVQDRSAYLGEGEEVFLVPSVAEIIAQKSASSHAPGGDVNLLGDIS